MGECRTITIRNICVCSAGSPRRRNLIYRANGLRDLTICSDNRNNCNDIGCDTCRRPSQGPNVLAAVQVRHHYPLKRAMLRRAQTQQPCFAPLQTRQASRERRLTLPSNGLAPAAQVWPSFHSGPSLRRLREPLMSNVRPRKLFFLDPARTRNTMYV